MGKIRALVKEDLEQINEIVAKLHPKWFDEEAVKNISKDLLIQKSFVALEDDVVVGFVSVISEEGKPKIGWLGVDPEWHRRGVGRKMLEYLENYLASLGYKDLRVDTVVEQDPDDGSYDLTMKFYRSLGYKVERKFAEKIAGKFKYRRGLLVKKLT